MTDLVRRLCEVYPVPESATHAHSRHYMPGKGDKKPLAFDCAFQNPCADA